MGAAELTLKIICRWSEEANSRKEAKADNVNFMEKLQVLLVKLEHLKEKKPCLSNYISDSRNEGELAHNLEAALRGKKQAVAELKKTPERLQSLL